MEDTTFLAGLRHDRIVTPLVLDGAINGRAFLAWVEQFLAPTLQPGDIVVAGVRQVIEARQALIMFLPRARPHADGKPPMPPRSTSLRRSRFRSDRVR